MLSKLARKTFTATLVIFLFSNMASAACYSVGQLSFVGSANNGLTEIVLLDANASPPRYYIYNVDNPNIDRAVNNALATKTLVAISGNAASCSLVGSNSYQGGTATVIQTFDVQ